MTVTSTLVPRQESTPLDAAWRALSEGQAALALTLFTARLGTGPRTRAEEAEAAFGLAHAVAALGQVDQAVSALERALVTAESQPDAFHALARAWTPLCTQKLAIHPVRIGLQKIEKASREQRLRHLNLLADIYQRAGDAAGAITVLYTLISVVPRTAAVMTRIGRLWMYNDDKQEALSFFNKALNLDPAYAPALDGIADTYLIVGDTAGVREALTRRAAASTDAAERAAANFRRASVQPAITMDEQEIDEARSRYEAALAAGPEAPMPDPYALGLGPNFYGNYHARPDRRLHEAAAAYFLKATPHLSENLCRVRPRAGKIRIGMVSNYFCAHTVGYLTRGLIEGLDRSRFELVLFRTPGSRFDSATAAMAQTAHVVDLPPQLADARRVIAESEMDIVHYPEIGMDTFSYFLAFARLAPLQTVGWGHPLTTGLSSIDLFLSVDDMEPPDGDAHYTETLVRLRNLSIDVKRPAPPQDSIAREKLGMEDGPAYVCAQSLYKIHPRFDGTLRLILEQDADGWIYLVSFSPHADGLLARRLQRSLGAYAKRVRFLPRVTAQEFLGLLRTADVLLDVPQWSGGKTSLEGLAMGTPIVHQPGEFMRGRHTLAFLRKMRMTNTVVDSPMAYAEMAVRLVHDRAFRSQVREHIADASGDLFGDVESIREIERVWIDALADRRN